MQSTDKTEAETREAKSPRVYLAPLFLDDPTCLQVRDAMSHGRVSAAEILTDGAFGADRDVRSCESIEVDAATLRHVEGRLDAVRASLAAFFNVRLTGREGAGFLRYHAGGFYRPHRDQAKQSVWPAAAVRRLSVVIFLNAAEAPGVEGDFSGGALRITDAARDVSPEAGTLVAFPATALHEVTIVGRGTRDVIVDWFS